VAVSSEGRVGVVKVKIEYYLFCGDLEPQSQQIGVRHLLKARTEDQTLRDWEGNS